MSLFRRLFAALLIVGVGPATCGAGPLPRAVLYIDQSTVGSRAYSEIFNALQNTLKAEANPSISIYAEALDPTHFGGDEHQRILANYLREKYSETAIGAVVAVGSAALKFAVRFRATHWPDVPVVFALVDSETAATETLPAGVTGNTIKLSLASSVAAARALVPGVKRL